MTRYSGWLRAYASAWRAMGCSCNNPNCGVCIARDPLTINEAEDMADFIDRLVAEKAEAESRAQAAERDAGRWRAFRDAGKSVKVYVYDDPDDPCSGDWMYNPSAEQLDGFADTLADTASTTPPAGDTGHG